jgi:hypothetical protein
VHSAWWERGRSCAPERAASAVAAYGLASVDSTVDIEDAPSGAPGWSTATFKRSSARFLSLHGAGYMNRLPDGKRHDRERRIACRRCQRSLSPPRPEGDRSRRERLRPGRLPKFARRDCRGRGSRRSYRSGR